MTPLKPYLVRAIYDWCVEQGMTPYATVVADEYTRVPRGHVKEGAITLNLDPVAVNKLRLGDDEITFEARFSGAVFPVVVPMYAVTAIFARENGQGMSFEPGAPTQEEHTLTDTTKDATPAADANTPSAKPKPVAGQRPQLKVVK